MAEVTSFFSGLSPTHTALNDGTVSQTELDTENKKTAAKIRDLDLKTKCMGALVAVGIVLFFGCFLLAQVDSDVASFFKTTFDSKH